MKQCDSGMNSMQSPHSKWGAKGYKLQSLSQIIICFNFSRYIYFTTPICSLCLFAKYKKSKQIVIWNGESRFDASDLQGYMQIKW
jgi:hypothetical protein